MSDADLMHEWEERRMAICVFDIGLSKPEARRTAREQISGRVSEASATRTGRVGTWKKRIFSTAREPAALID